MCIKMWAIVWPMRAPQNVTVYPALNDANEAVTLLIIHMADDPRPAAEVCFVPLPRSVRLGALHSSSCEHAFSHRQEI